MPISVDDFIAHYSSENYDPVKAHEYYLKNRELKGRQQTTSGMSEVQKQAWAYTKNKIGTDKKAELTSMQDSQKARLEAISKQAEAMRERIKEKLEALVRKLQGQKSIPLHEIPENATPKTRARLIEQNKKLSQTNQRVASEKSAVARKAASAELVKVATEMKDTVAKARDSYEAAKKEVVAKYEATTNTEYENIRTKLPSAPPPAPKKAAAPKKPRAPRKPRASKKDTDEDLA